METEVAETEMSKSRQASPEKASSTKRKGSPSPERDDSASKRPRRDSAQDDAADDRPYDEAERRRSVTQEEKKRGMRLFGGLLNTLSQKTTTTQQKKRQEIEKRQQERAQQQRAEDDKRRQEKLSRLTEIRKREQIQFDEKVMKLRHRNLLAAAHSLKTKAEPPIYYLPYKLTREQEDIIDDQIEDAKAIISKDLDELYERKGERRKSQGPSRPSTARGETQPDVPDDTDNAAAPTQTTNSRRASQGSRTGQDRLQHDEGDVVVDADEDMVIY